MRENDIYCVHSRRQRYSFSQKQHTNGSIFLYSSIYVYFCATIFSTESCK